MCRNSHKFGKRVAATHECNQAHEVANSEKVDLEIANLENLRDELLEERNSQNIIKRCHKCPHILIKIEDLVIPALMDSGSEVTAISENFYLENKKIFEDCSKLPINGKIVKGSLKGPSTIVKFQIICREHFDTHIEDIIFLIIPNLGKNFIIGYDTIEELYILIDPSLHEVRFEEKSLFIPFLKFDDQSIEAEESHNISLISEINEIQAQNNNSDNFRSFKEEGDEKLFNNNNINAQEKAKLAALICEFQEIFTNKSGLIQNFTYHLRVKNNDPFYVKP